MEQIDGFGEYARETMDLLRGALPERKSNIYCNTSSQTAIETGVVYHSPNNTTQSGYGEHALPIVSALVFDSLMHLQLISV